MTRCSKSMRVYALIESKAGSNIAMLSSKGEEIDIAAVKDAILIKNSNCKLREYLSISNVLSS